MSAPIATSPFATSIPGVALLEAPATTSNALTTTQGRFEAPPELVPLQQSTGTALVVATPEAKRGMFAWLSRSKPTWIDDPNFAETTRAYNQVATLRSQIAQVHATLPNDALVLKQAPSHWEQLFTPYDVARASAIAVMAGIKVRLDMAAAAGATAAIMPSRGRYAEAVEAVKAADAECTALMGIARSRHGDVKAVADAAAQAAAQVASSRLAERETIKELTGKRRTSLVDRIRQLQAGNYGFCTKPYGAQVQDVGDHGSIPADGVIPTLVLQGHLYFGKLNGPAIFWDANQPNPKMTTLAELADLVDALMGRDPDAPANERTGSEG